MPLLIRSRRLPAFAAGVTVLAVSSLLTLFSASEAQAATATCQAAVCTVSFGVSGVPEGWTVPAGVSHISVTVAAGSGGSSQGSPLSLDTASGGAGGETTATLPVTAGSTLTAVVGAAGGNGVDQGGVHAAGGYGGGGNSGDTVNHLGNGGGAGAGGGGSFLFDGSDLLVAAGGGGGGAISNARLQNGGDGGSTGDAGQTPVAYAPSAPYNGQGATATAPGAAGQTHTGNSSGTGPATSSSALGVGGAGGTNDNGYGYMTSGGGGGGGYFGGGGGGTWNILFYAGGGGGGAGFIAPAATNVTTSSHRGDGAITITYSRQTTTTTLTASADPMVGSPTILTATVSPSLASTADATFTDGSTMLGTAPVANGVATLATNLAGGTHSITASFAGDDAYVASISSPLIVHVAPQVTTTALTVSAKPTAGAPATLTATVAPSTGSTATVEFFDGTTSLGTVPLSSGTATLSATLPAGSHSLTAVFEGDANHATSTSGPDVVTVAKAVTTTTLRVSGTPTAGKPMMLIARVVPSAGAIGTVSFFDGTAFLGRVPLSSGTAALSVSLQAGTHSIVAVFAGDANHVTSTSAPDVVAVAKAVTMTTLGVSGTPTAGKVSTFTATVVPSGGATGTVEFFDGTTSLGAVPLSSGMAALSVSLPAGTHSIVARYFGSSEFAPSTSVLSVMVATDNQTRAPHAIAADGPGSKALAVTGSDPAPAMVLAMILLLVGAAIRRHSVHAQRRS